MKLVFEFILILLAMTLVIEAIPALFFKNKKKWLVGGFWCNIITNPIINTIICLCTAIIGRGSAILVITVVLEILVILVEGYLYAKYTGESKKKCMKVSVALNTLSAIIGMMFFGLLEFYEEYTYVTLL